MAITNGHGDRYPPEAAGLIETLPRRVAPSQNERTVGAVRLDAGGEIPEISSESHRDWGLAKAARQRLGQLGIKTQLLHFHVEMKVAALIADTGQTHAEVALNYTPCGYERQRRLPKTCHRLLERFLPEGHSLTIYGTTQDNEPFRHTYTGKGPQWTRP